jgi:hypothetical protein
MKPTSNLGSTATISKRLPLQSHHSYPRLQKYVHRHYRPPFHRHPHVNIIVRPLLLSWQLDSLRRSNVEERARLEGQLRKERAESEGRAKGK